MAQTGKDLWHLVRVFSNLWPSVFKCWAEETHRLADLLGDDHDLAVLRGALDTAEGKIARGNGALRAATPVAAGGHPAW